MIGALCHCTGIASHGLGDALLEAVPQGMMQLEYVFDGACAAAQGLAEEFPALSMQRVQMRAELAMERGDAVVSGRRLEIENLYKLLIAVERFFALVFPGAVT